MSVNVLNSTHIHEITCPSCGGLGAIENDWISLGTCQKCNGNGTIIASQLVKDTDTLVIHGYTVRILRINSKRYGAEWRGYDGQLVRIFRPTKGQLLAAIEGIMRLREDI